MSLTIKEHLLRAGAFVGLIKKHEADLTDLADDVPKAISIAQDFHDLFKDYDVKVSVEPAQTGATEPQIPAPKPAAAPAAPRVTAAHAAQHVKEKGMSEAERAQFERASQNVG